MDIEVFPMISRGISELTRMAPNRRTLLAAVGTTASLSVAGCLETLASSPSRSADGPVVPVARNGTDHVEDNCGPASRSISELLTNQPGDPVHCFEGATPSFVIENERSDSVSVDIDLESNTTFVASYELDPNEQVVESNGFEAGESTTGTITVADETWEVDWPRRSCYRYGVSILPETVEIGWVKPISGPGDTQHDCYPGSALPIEIRSAGESRTVDIALVDRCDGTTVEESISIGAGEHDRLDNRLVSGGVYDVSVDIDGGETTAKNFDPICWGVTVRIQKDGKILIGELAID